MYHRSREKSSIESGKYKGVTQRCKISVPTAGSKKSLTLTTLFEKRKKRIAGRLLRTNSLVDYKDIITLILNYQSTYQAANDMNIFKNFIIPGYGGKPMSTDIFFHSDARPKPLVIYAHGFNGFKDWGNFNMIAEQFVDAGFVFVKFNFSHNGTTPDHPEEFVDLEGYGHNNYTIQLEELQKVIGWCLDEKHHYAEEIYPNHVYLLGHSLGGGLVILKAAEDERVKKIVTWAAISVCKTPWGNWPEEKIAEWKNTGVAYTMNSRTKQELPLYFQLYENFQHNAQRLNIQAAIKKLNIPVLLCHGTKDEGVPIEKAKDLKAWQPKAQLFLVESDHVFGRKHPWFESELPVPMQAVVNKSISFLKG